MRVEHTGTGDEGEAIAELEDCPEVPCWMGEGCDHLRVVVLWDDGYVDLAHPGMLKEGT